MDLFTPIFVTQLITSFVVGGAVIAFQSVLAERTSARVSGFMLTIPSTTVISFFFIGYVTDAQTVADIIPVTPITLAVFLVAITAYGYLSRLKLKKAFSVLISTLACSLIWLILAIPLAVYQFSNLIVSLTVYAIIALCTHKLLAQVCTDDKPIRVKYTSLQKITRAAFAGFMISFIVFVSKALGPFWGGVFAMFPATNLSASIIIHSHHSSSFLLRTLKGVPLGSTILVVYNLAVMLIFPSLGIVWGSLASFIVSMVYMGMMITVPKYFQQ